MLRPIAGFMKQRSLLTGNVPQIALVVLVVLHLGRNGEVHDQLTHAGPGDMEAIVGLRTDLQHAAQGMRARRQLLECHVPSAQLGGDLLVRIVAGQALPASTVN
jgi:hypothetical protein